MRALVLSGLAALTISLMAPAAAWAWSTEQASPNSAAGSAALAEQEDPLKALQDKVDGKNGSKPSGFYFSAGPTQQPFGPTGFRSNLTDTAVPPVYSPNPGFRGRLD